MNRLLTLSTFLLLSIMTFAQTLVKGIYYEFSGTEAMVVSGAKKYTGSVTIPASVYYEQTYGVKSIGSYAFEGCSGLTSVTIPNSVTSIEQGAFLDCSGLTSVYSYIDEPTSIIYLVNDYTNVTLYVPYGTKAKYQTTDGWKNFANIVEMSDPSAINGVNAEDAKSFVGKIIKDNRIIIMKHGKKHSVSGQGM
ncbi:MAG: leucine-rich repeat protein [Prevotella sp.]|nr:leucine-rich repeat protein [Prevotella sp.]